MVPVRRKSFLVSLPKDIILFIDEIHTIVGAGAAEGAIDAANILKPQLARGDLQIIGATTYEEYRKYIEKDAALERRFQPIRINEPSEEDTVEMLRALKERYELHHGVFIEDEAINECVALSKKYINDRYLPDKAIDILDEACALAVNKSGFFKTSANTLGQFDTLSGKQDKNIIDIRIICEAEYPTKRALEIATDKPNVTESHVKDVISEACGIPASLIRKQRH